jgi:hypothetical protein
MKMKSLNHQVADLIDCIVSLQSEFPFVGELFSVLTSILRLGIAFTNASSTDIDAQYGKNGSGVGAGGEMMQSNVADPHYQWFEHKKGKISATVSSSFVDACNNTGNTNSNTTNNTTGPSPEDNIKAILVKAYKLLAILTERIPNSFDSFDSGVVNKEIKLLVSYAGRILDMLSSGGNGGSAFVSTQSQSSSSTTTVGSGTSANVSNVANVRPQFYTQIPDICAQMLWFKHFGNSSCTSWDNFAAKIKGEYGRFPADCMDRLRNAMFELASSGDNQLNSSTNRTEYDTSIITVDLFARFIGHHTHTHGHGHSHSSDAHTHNSHTSASFSTNAHTTGCGFYDAYQHTCDPGTTLLISGCLDNSNESYSEPTIVSSLCGYKIHKISCGGQHVAVIVNSGQLLTWGKGDFGRLGLGNTVSVSVPTLVTIPPVASSGALSPDTSNHGIGMNNNNNSGHGGGGGSNGSGGGGGRGVCVVDVACGFAYTVAISDSGTAYSWGAGKWNCVSIYVCLREYVCARMCVCIYVCACQQFICVCLFESGENGRLGLGDIRSRNEPTEVMALRGKHIVSVGAGSVHTCFLDAQGGLYSTGKSEYAGHGALGDVHVPTYLNHAFVDDGTDTPATNTHNGGQRKHGAVVSMSVGPGGYHSIILTADNHIYCWGKFWVFGNVCGYLFVGACIFCMYDC